MRNGVSVSADRLRKCKMGSSETTPLALATSLSVAMAAGTPAWEGAPGASPKPSPSPGLSPAVVPDAATSQARVPERLDSFGSPDSAGLAQHGGVSPTFNANKFGSPGSVVHSPHHTQGTHGHVAKMVDWVQGAATEELVPLSAEKPTRQMANTTPRKELPGVRFPAAWLAVSPWLRVAHFSVYARHATPPKPQYWFPKSDEACVPRP